MYSLKPHIKADPVRRWALPDRIFFGFGACHILAGMFLKNPPIQGFYGERIIPKAGFSGNHIFVTDGEIAFDFHGYVLRDALLKHHEEGLQRIVASNWSCNVDRVAFDLLSQSDLNQHKMLGPLQYLQDARPRAQRFLGRICHDTAYARARKRA